MVFFWHITSVFHELCSWFIYSPQNSCKVMATARTYYKILFFFLNKTELLLISLLILMVESMLRYFEDDC